jgi:hypothetical protein
VGDLWYFPLGTDDNGLLGALESVDLIFKLGNLLLSIKRSTSTSG